MKAILKKLIRNTFLWILVAMVLGFVAGTFANYHVAVGLVTVRTVFSTIVNFMIPIIVLGMVAPALARLLSGGTKLILISVLVIYGVHIVAAVFGVGTGYAFSGLFEGMTGDFEARNQLPSSLITLNMPPLMPPLAAVVLGILIGISAIATKSAKFTELLDDFHKMTKFIIAKVFMPIIPFLIFGVFGVLAYETSVLANLSSFGLLLLITSGVTLVFLVLMWIVATVYVRKNPFPVIKSYTKPYLMAFATMSGAATMPLIIRELDKNPQIDKRVTDAVLPMFTNIMMPAVMIMGTFLAVTISAIVYGAAPPVWSVVLFAFMVVMITGGVGAVPGGSAAMLALLAGEHLGFSDLSIGIFLAVWFITNGINTLVNVGGDGPVYWSLSKHIEKNKETFTFRA